MSATPPQVRAVVDAMMRQVRAVFGDAGVAKLQAAVKGSANGSQPEPASHIRGGVSPGGNRGGDGVPPVDVGGGQSGNQGTRAATPDANQDGMPSHAAELTSQRTSSQPVASAIPAELTVAMFEAASEGDWKAVDDLAELGSDPEGLSEFLADRDAGTQGMMSARAFAAMTRNFAGQTRTFSWFHDPTPRSKSRITNSQSGAHAYGSTAKRIMDAQGREQRGEPHPETPKQMLERRKAEAEPKREAARQAYQKALADPGSLTRADIEGLRDHLHTLTRDEVKQNLRAVMFKAGGKLKADLVDGLLEHVRGNAVKYHEDKLDPLGMGLDQDVAARAIQDLKGTSLPADKKARDPALEAEHLAKNDHNKRREERQQLMQNVSEGSDKTSHDTPDLGSKLKQPDKMLDVRTLAPENRAGLTLDQQVKKPAKGEPEEEPAAPRYMPSAASVTKSPTGEPEEVHEGDLDTPAKPEAKGTTEEADDKSPLQSDESYATGVSKILGEIPRIPNLSPEDAAVQERAIQRVQKQYPQLRESYLAANATRNPDGSLKSVVLNTDEWRGLFADDGYTGTNSAAVHEASSAANKALTAEMLKEMAGKGNNQFLVLAGGGGSGKGSAVSQFFDQSEYPLVLDQVSDNLPKLEAKIQEAVAHGYKPAYTFIDRQPEGAWNGVVGRADTLRKKGKLARTVPLKDALKANIAARTVALQLLDKYGDQMQPRTINNNGKPGQAILMEDKAEAAEYLKTRLAADEAQVSSGLEEKLRQNVLSMYASGQLDEDIARGFVGHEAIESAKKFVPKDGLEPPPVVKKPTKPPSRPGSSR